ncbi:conserved membrane hypothetical protein [Planktothrix sp. PCC 11201]|uniref:MarC family protein n=1 Tax=Planktothrix sp. PCC 11201 TaxID=1729650 RepID=UPI0009108C0B|nr:MarC family protein [Planktothrix sp. PCC 11201]SKB15873.1 conserved membrane hypothetical protein [Planktothrix sp. PCC 11201]
MTNMIADFLTFVLASFASLFPIVDPLGAVPIFLILASGYSIELKQKCALKTTLSFVAVLVFFLLIGESIMGFFGLGMSGVKVAGGIIIFEAGWEALKAEPKLTATEEEALTTQLEEHKDISFIPLTVPLLAGPGAITVTLGLAAQAREAFSTETLLHLGAIIVAIIIIGITVYGCLILSNHLLNLLGENGIIAFTRLLGLFILALGVQLILSGLENWVKTLFITH